MTSNNSTLLFLGDSVTDCSRKRALRFQSSDSALGYGWVKKIHDVLTSKSPQTDVINRGFAGCRINELTTQNDWWPDRVDDRADIITLMIGINDIWHPFWKNEPHKIDATLKSFSTLISMLHQRSTHLVVCEPVALPTGEVTEPWWPLLYELSQGQRDICSQKGVYWLPLEKSLLHDSQPRFQDYLQDGVHPTDLGHQWLARQWLSFISDNQLLE